MLAPAIDPSPPGCRRADHGAGGRACRLLRAVRARAIRTISDLKGKRVGVQTLGSGDALCYLCDHGGPCRARPAQGHQLGRRRTSWQQPMELFVAGKIDAFLGFPPEPQELRARKIGRVILNTTTDKPWSQYFCCMLVGNSGLRPTIIRSRPSASCVPSSRPPTSARRAGAGRAAAGRWRVHERYDYALQTLTEHPLRQLARVRPRGLAAVLRAAPPRGRHDHVQPEPAHRRGHRLALPERAQARAEGVTSRRSAAAARNMNERRL